VSVILISLGVYVILRLYDEYLTTPIWFFFILVIGLSLGGVLIAGDSWWWSFGTAGLVLFWRAIEEVLTALRDWLRMLVLRGPTRR
jgi:hypothetical protein